MNRTDRRIQIKPLWIISVVIAVVVMLSAKYRYRSGEIDYHNSDATWHALLTIEAYNETPISQHLFLPIVTLGDLEDKFIPWGATIPDDEGNYYYTSFSPMGYFLPWLFIKMCRLPVNETSLYIFNTFLFALSACLLVWLLALVYRDNKNRTLLCLTGGLIYAMLPELLHGMGIVYWHQSILQVTLLLQIIAYYQYAVLKNNRYQALFYILAFLNPYTEWTGYLANVGFAIAEIVINWKSNWKKGFSRAFILGLITVASLFVFCAHYLLRTDAKAFFLASKERFLVRNIATNIPMLRLIKGYLASFRYAWVLLLVLAIWNVIKKRKIEMRGGIMSRYGIPCAGKPYYETARCLLFL